MPASPPLRVLQIASFYSPTIGGMETVLQALAEGLVARGDEVTVLCSAEGVRGADEMDAGVRVIRSPSLGKLLSQPLSLTLPFSLARMHGSFDVVHLHMPNPLAELATLTLPRRVPVVVTYHTDIIRQRALRPLYAPVRDAVLERCRRIVVPTENHIRCSEVLPPLRDKCVVVPFGIPAARYRLDAVGRALADDLRARHGRFVLFVGRLVYYKGLSTLLESARDVDAPIVVVGDGPLRAETRAKIEELGLGSRVFLAGAVGQAELNAYLDACSVLVLPSVSRSEGFGMTLLEGMLFGKPLVTTRLPSGVQLVNDDGVTGLQVEPRDPRGLAAALNRLLSDEALRASMGAAARARLDSRFSLEGMISGYRAVYEEALGR
jgi:glycosyltransferase involved in cell wall biosynthesis